MPRTALIKRSNIGFRLFFIIFLYKMAKPAKESNKQIDIRSKTMLWENNAFPEKSMIFVNKTIVVEAINAKTTGLTPFNEPCTKRFFKNLESIRATRIMMMNEGKMTPNVEHTAPKAPAVCEPTKVEILIAKGPGVDSLIAIKSVN